MVLPDSPLRRSSRPSVGKTRKIIQAQWTMFSPKKRKHPSSCSNRPTVEPNVQRSRDYSEPKRKLTRRTPPSVSESDSEEEQESESEAEGDTSAFLNAQSEYEALREANMRANLEMMKSLGILESSKMFAKPASPKKTVKKEPTPSSSPSPGKKNSPYSDRPLRMTRSLSRTQLPHASASANRTRGRAESASPSMSTRPAHFIIDDESPKRKSSSSLNPKRSYRDESTLQRSADRLGTRIHSPKVFGPIPNIAVGTWWEKRMHCSTDAVHAPVVAGISGHGDVGCWSICLSGGYEDDVDLGTTFTYTGSGGRDLKGTASNPKNLRTAEQSSDQSFENPKNAAILKSVKTGKPIRVVRGFKGNNRYCPEEGYVYCGLYKAEKAWLETGKSGFRVCRFKFVRLPGQLPLPTFDHSEGGGSSQLAIPSLRSIDQRSEEEQDDIDRFSNTTDEEEHQIERQLVSDTGAKRTRTSPRLATSQKSFRQIKRSRSPAAPLSSTKISIKSASNLNDSRKRIKKEEEEFQIISVVIPALNIP